MADPTPDTSADAGVEADRRSTAGMPRWVKVSLIIVGILVVLFVALRLTGVGGQHGPGRHVGPAGGSGQSPSSGVTEHRPPPGIPNHGG